MSETLTKKKKKVYFLNPHSTLIRQRNNGAQFSGERLPRPPTHEVSEGYRKKRRPGGVLLKTLIRLLLSSFTVRVVFTFKVFDVIKFRSRKFFYVRFTRYFYEKSLFYMSN